ncbi:TetR/AcrR family transcriptional regulator [Paenibacillus mucilaginosus]|uniref:TetR family transcriptional regulator n=3 Tax=Paenibacillus mucilaginosus TaxID=61624 RepID=H6NP53_9BACL|nr:TetR/AcrR family transcriptional regulator [Paenibacillus mucilaginosus]AEI43481.1 Transcriptional regulator, TetR [Paenibacillus mucilaginosus KNP414]AFC31127.1 TetR family transcriptional regulator [Paenibacillus mucilaginosus 3016]AFH63447.1 TetR family transcriptional regulator [Paenibacillus mucilaginosus K02]MCG7211972.1 TetR/AcrR family transcriptional regulator [Paenibacillus mucilaginosus]WDM25038.1 TetR/AcrR family transcriptional regulator [Paenibacillus mucilaginosus]
MPVTRPPDRRIQRTRQMIADAFLSLLHRRPYEDISVLDISVQANINRSTFYAHYTDKEDLLTRMLTEHLGRLEELLAGERCRLPSPPTFHEPDPLFLALFEHLSEHQLFYGAMLACDTPANIQDRMQKLLREIFYRRLSGIGMDQKVQVPLDLLLDYASCAVQGTIAKWFADNRVYSPHHMALQLTRLSLLGTYEAMGLR